MKRRKEKRSLDELWSQLTLSAPKPPDWFKILNRENKANGKERDPRLPPTGTILFKEYQGKTIGIQVLNQHFQIVEPDGNGGWKGTGRFYRSISTATRHFTVYEVNGYRFWGLT